MSGVCSFGSFRVRAAHVGGQRVIEAFMFDQDRLVVFSFDGQAKESGGKIEG